MAVLHQNNGKYFHLQHAQITPSITAQAMTIHATGDCNTSQPPRKKTNEATDIETVLNIAVSSQTKSYNAEF